MHYTVNNEVEHVDFIIPKEPLIGKELHSPQALLHLLEWKTLHFVNMYIEVRCLFDRSPSFYLSIKLEDESFQPKVNKGDEE